MKRHKPKRYPTNLYRSTDTLCWRCANSVNSGCSWSESFEPVQGWTAEEKFKINEPYGKTYLVKDCPEFERG